MSSSQSGPSETPPSGAKDLEEIRTKLQQLHDEGIVDVEVPLREMIPKLAELAVAARQRAGDRARSEEAEAMARGYCFVGDKSWFDHF